MWEGRVSAFELDLKGGGVARQQPEVGKREGKAIQKERQHSQEVVEAIVLAVLEGLLEVKEAKFSRRRLWQERKGARRRVLQVLCR